MPGSSLSAASKRAASLNAVIAAATEYAICAVDASGRILLWNEGARRLYGYDASEVVGLANSCILHTPEDLAAGELAEILKLAPRDDEFRRVI